jgi:hypothetical protein
MEQQIQFCTTEDGVRIACATVGEGPPLVKAANWLSHLEFDWRSPIWRHLRAEFSYDHSFIRNDERGNGSNTIWIDPEHDLVVVWRWHQDRSDDELIKRILAAVKTL